MTSNWDLNVRIIARMRLSSVEFFFFFFYAGRLTLTPSIMTSICSGDQLLLTCNSSTDLHQWSILDPATGRTYTRLIAVPTTAVAVITPLEVQSITFSFDVISASNALPLISTLTVDSVTDYLNTSRIVCSEIDSGNSEMVSINVLGPNPLKGEF